MKTKKREGSEGVTYEQRLLDLRRRLDEKEREVLSPWACFSSDAVRRKNEERILRGHRQNFFT